MGGVASAHFSVDPFHRACERACVADSRMTLKSVESVLRAADLRREDETSSAGLESRAVIQRSARGEGVGSRALLSRLGMRASALV